MTTDNLNKQQPDNDSLWDIVSDIVDQLQFVTETAKSSAELIQKLLTVDQLPGISKEELSIVYCEYGTQDYKLIVDAGNEVDSTSSSSGTFGVTNLAIRDVAINPLKPEEYPWFNTKADCANAGFDGFGTVMIVPMRLGRYRRLGVFIIHSKEEHAYSKRLQRVMDVLSDRLAALIRSLRRRLRDELTYKLRNELLARLASRQRMFEGECEILKQVLGHLRTWYDYDRIHILMKNPLDIETYYQAIDENGEVRTNFRATQVLEQPALLQIMGEEGNLNRLKMPPSDIPNEGMDALHGIIIEDTAKLPGFLAECKSWLGVTMHHPDGYVFGHIILHDTEMPYAYDKDDLRFMDAIADFMGFLLAEYRSKQKKAVIQEISSLPLNKPEALYGTVAAYLRRLYGVEHFQIRAIKLSSQDWKLVWPINEDENTLSRALGNDSQNIIAKFANENRVRKDYGNEPLKLLIEEQNYLVTPMRAGTLEEDWRVIGVFVIPANNPGRIASNVIDEVSDALGNRLNSSHSQQRYEALTAFVNEVHRLPSANLTQERVLQIAHEHIKKVMFSENVYIALYDEAENSISFPLIYRNGKVWEAMHNQKRKIDPTQLGRTEVIIRDKKPLFIKTKADSLGWYAKPNHKEHAGNPLASWIGVPIFSASEGNEQKVRGVIAAYHEEVDHVYSIRDVFFLQNVAGAVSGLFRLLELKEANQRLEEEIANNTALKEAQIKIAEQQHILSTSLLAQDLTHRINNSIGSISINITQACRDINSVLKLVSNADFLQFTLEGLEDSNVMLNDLVRETKKISDDTAQPIVIKKLLEKTIKQVSLGKRLEEIGVNITSSIPDGIPDIHAHYRTLFNSIYAIIDNAADALREQNISAANSRSLYLSTNAYNNNSQIIIEISDNGCFISEKTRNHLFEYGVSTKGTSGFGLWRANAVITSLGGSIEFSEDTINHMKTFRINLPICSGNFDEPKSAVASKIAYILDDEKSWRNILTRWLRDVGFEVQVAGSKEEMFNLLENKQSIPSHVFLDISLDSTDGANLDGLGLIEAIKKNHPGAKIILVTGYADFAVAYRDQYDLLIEKISSDGEILSKEGFIKQIGLLSQSTISPR